MDVTQELRKWFVDRFLFGDESRLTDDVSLLEAGLIDSTGVVEAANYMEDTYKIKVLNDELLPENFDSISAMAAFLSHKRSAPEN